MKKVQVLLSSYNGEKYIREQIDSILKQKDVVVYCLVRDDGSTDDTVQILKEYKKEYPNFDYVEGENVGYKKSFQILLQMTGNYDYYAFSDQDDIWMPRKLISAVKKISTESSDIPILYCSNCILVNKELTEIGILHKKNILPNSKYRALVQGFAHGCTMVMNKNSRNLMLRYTPKIEYAHDYWIPILHLFLGKILYDSNAYILYRQHENNVFGGRRSFFKKIKASLNKYKVSSFYSNLIKEILSGYYDMLSKNDQKLLTETLDYKNSFYLKLKLFFNKELRKSTIRGTLIIKLLILLSKF
ncbi:alpha-L-Rha alpha-1,3-L-rhamnosyltransferase [Weizmannia acidilactici]|uniref:glycosyltransferase family 2 protein n=1 Tax=Heyndrickxia TaxID=2837504 RepID=UPI000211027C|nr:MULTISPECIES: glycosyltransferase family 2 protein [Heyndrickxia]AEH52406.1 putative glycosyl transferase [Heyndrickxia coagulans 2-6]GER67958.1 alpha-L-Rha alpha-1,3-L-rhamnosyltransferase [Weizmannia acidilactici]